MRQLVVFMCIAFVFFITGCQAGKPVLLELPITYNGTVSGDSTDSMPVVVKTVVDKFFNLPAESVRYGNNAMWHNHGFQFVSILKDSFVKNGLQPVFNDEEIANIGDYSKVIEDAKARKFKYAFMISVDVVTNNDDSVGFSDRLYFALFPARQYTTSLDANMNLKVDVEITSIDAETEKIVFQKHYSEEMARNYQYSKVNKYYQITKTRGYMFAEMVTKELSQFWEDFMKQQLQPPAVN